MEFEMPPEHLIIFTRYPIAGKAKTRLIPALGAEGAAALQRQFTELTLCRAIALSVARGVRIEVRYEGGSEPLMRAWLGPTPRYTPQGAGDLGQRLARAAQDAFDENAGCVVIIGADCPRLDEPLLNEAFDALRAHPIVFGPAQDGGYYLLGLCRPMPALFQDIPWSTSSVLTQCVRIARTSGYEPALLRTLPDVDEPADLDDWYPWQSQLQRVSVIIPTLNEAGHLAETLRHVAAANPHEVIIADGGSTDETMDLATSAGAGIVHSTPGRGAQLNAGARHATGELLFFLHADTLPPPSYTSSIADTLRSPQTIAGSFRFALREPRPAMAGIIERLTRWRSEQRNLPYGDQGIFIRRAMFEAIGCFPEWPLLEDLEFIRRARRHGSIVIHQSRIQTSGRRWQRGGFVTTFMRHQMILLGYYSGLPPERLARWR